MQIEKQFYTWQEFNRDIKEIAERLRALGRKFDGVWGPPLGGLIPAVVLSHALKIPLLLKPTAKTLVVDDIADTGKTLASYERNYIVTLFYHQQSTIAPKIWLREKKDAHIVFPWEIEDWPSEI